VKRLVPIALSLIACRGVALDRLAARVRRQIAANHPELKVTRPDPMTFRVQDAAGHQVTLGLDNLRLQCETRPAECDHAIAVTVGSLPTQFQVAASEQLGGRETVRAVLKDAKFVEMMRQQIARSPRDKAADNALVIRPLAGDLSIVYVFDLPTSTQLINHGSLHRLGLSEEQLHALAMKNLEAALTTLPKKHYSAAQPGNHVWVVEVGDDYEASRLLVNHFWEIESRQVSGKLLAAVPCRHMLLFTGSANATDVALLRGAARELEAREHHPISATVLEWTGSGWTVAN
jgi:uncharacterized protein YtpQ (UPF0354 family)